MSISATHSLSGATTSYSAPAGREPSQILGQDDFLKLLVAQLSAQDPMNPQKDTEFIAQMAQFSALEQSRAMQTDISGMRGEQQILHATSMIGRTVSVADDSGALVTGVVTGVNLAGDHPQIVLNGAAYPLSQVLGVAATPTPTPTPN